MFDISENVSKLKVIVSESDGIITDGKMPVDELSNVPFKNFCYKDLEVINFLKKHFKVVFISKYSEINYNFFRKKNIPFYWAERSKIESLRKLTDRYSVTLDEVLYIGSSYEDLQLINRIPFSICPKDAVAEVRDKVSLRLNTSAGEGVLCEVYSILNQAYNSINTLNNVEESC